MDPLMEVIPLHCVEAEEALLGWMILATGPKLKSAAREVQDRWFFRASHRMLFPIIQRLANSGSADAVTVKAELVRKDLLDAVGGEETLIRCMQAGQGVGNVDLVIRVLRENWQLRELETLGMEIIQLPRHPDLDTEEKLSKAQSLARSTLFYSGDSILDLTQIEIGADDEQGVTTGIPKVDALTGGQGLIKGQTAGICAYHKGGKTALLIELALAAMRAGKNVVYATLADLSPVQIKRRMLKQICGMSRPPLDFEALQDFDDALAWLNDQFKDGGCRIYDGAKHGRYVEDLSARILSAHLETPVDFLVVDYIQKAKSRKRGAREGKTAEMEYVSDDLKELAEDLNCPLPFGSQITKGTTSRDQTTKYARAMEEDAGMVIQIGEFDDTTNGSPVELNIPPHRFGPSGKVTVYWNKARVRFDV